MKAERAAGLGVLGVLGTLLVWNLGFVLSHCEQLRPYRSGDIAPDFALASAAGGGEGRLSAQRGHVVLVDFWATWCEPCRETMPAIERLYQRFRGAGFEVMSVNIEGVPARARRFAETFKPPLTFPVFVDDGRASARYKVDSIPHMVLVDKKGIVRDVHVGAFAGSSERDLADEIQELLAE